MQTSRQGGCLWAILQVEKLVVAPSCCCCFWLLLPRMHGLEDCRIWEDMVG